MLKLAVTNWGIFPNDKGLEISVSFADRGPEIASGITLEEAIANLFDKIYEIGNFAITSSSVKVEADGAVATISTGNHDFEGRGVSDVAALIGAIGEAAYFFANRKD